MTDDSGNALILLCLCDFQSRLRPFMLPPSLGISDGKPVGGLARVSAYTKQQRALHPGNLLAVALGVDPVGPLYRYFGGRAEYHGLHLAGFNALVPGEHEVDLGPDHFRRSFEFIRTPILCANLRPSGARPPVWTDHLVCDVPAGKVGLFGLTAPPASDGFAEGPCLVETGELVETARQQVQQLQRKGCRMIVALTHMGLENDKNLAQSVAGLHAVLGANSHTPTPEPAWERGPDGNPVPVVQAVGGGAALGRLVLSLDRRRRDDCRWRQMFMTGQVDEDADTAALIEGFYRQLQNILQRPVAELARPLATDPDDILTGRSPLGFLLADGIRRAGRSQVGLFAAPDIVSGDELPAGRVSRADLYRLMPFGNTVWEVTVSGRQLMRLMTGALSSRNRPPGRFQGAKGLWEPCFLYFSGLKIQTGRPLRLWVAEDEAWQPLEEQRTYRVAAPFLLRQGGRGCRALAKASGRNLALQEVEAVADLMAGMGRVAPPKPGERLIEN